MAGEITVVRGTTKTLVSSGAAVSSGAMSAASASTYGTSADGANFPDAEFVINTSFGSAPTANTTLALYARALDIDGTSDAPAPSTTYKQRYIGRFVVSTATAQTLILRAEDVPLLAEYYVLNDGTGQSMSSTWTLKATPISYKPAA